MNQMGIIMKYEATVLEKVTEFIRDGKMFTSVDLANAVKLEGLWVRNREVKDWLHDHFDDEDLFVGYTITQISVCSGSSIASLYHPLQASPDHYLDRNLRPLTPDEVNTIAKTKVGSVKTSQQPDLNSMLPDSIDDPDEDDLNDVSDEMCIVIRSKQRIKIPGAIIRGLGWAPGQTVDPALIVTEKVINGKLEVNSDYRVSIPRSAVPWGTDPVKVILRDGKIIFEKA